MLENLLEDVYAGKFGTKNRAELISRLEELKKVEQETRAKAYDMGYKDGKNNQEFGLNKLK